MDTQQFIETLVENGFDNDSIIDFVRVKQARIDELEYVLSICMCEHEDAEYMTVRERDSMALKVLRGTT
jgi:DNA-binding GntR family transcriptional regulator